MGQTLVTSKQDNKLIARIAELEKIVQGMRANQVQKISYGNITIDGTGAQGVITVGTGITITVDNNGVGLITVGNISISGTGTITVTDGTNNRILIGYQQSGF